MSSNYSVNVSESVKKLFMDNIIDKDAAESFGKGSRTILAPDLETIHKSAQALKKGELRKVENNHCFNRISKGGKNLRQVEKLVC